MMLSGEKKDGELGFADMVSLSRQFLRSEWPDSVKVQVVNIILEDDGGR